MWFDRKAVSNEPPLRSQKSEMQPGWNPSTAEWTSKRQPDPSGQYNLFPDERPSYEWGRPRPELPQYVAKGKTSGVLRTSKGDFALRSGYAGPASAMPEESPGFDGYTRAHVEGHAAAIMRQEGITEATLHINNPTICKSCSRRLRRMLPPGSVLNVVLPDGTVVSFKGREP
jgi:hypothetical protein